MDRSSIVGELAKAKVVETLVSNITHSNRVEVADLAQMVYLILLEKPEEEIIKVYEDGAMMAYLAVIIRKQWTLPNTPFFQQYRKFQILTSKATDEDNEDLQQCT